MDGLHYKELYRQDLVWQCTCSRQRIENVLLSLRQSDRDTILEDPQVEMTCHYCGSKYVISHDELVELFKQGRGDTK